MAAGALTTLITKNPAAGIAVMGGGSAVTERYLSPGEFFEEKGLKLDRAADREKLLNDPKLMQEAAERGVIRALVVGSFDALSGGLAGKAIAGNPFVEALAQTATQAVLGASGEALARGAAGQKMDWNEVFGEGLGEMATLPVDMIVAGRGGTALPADTGPGQAGDVIPPEEEGLPAEGAGVDSFKAEPLFRPAPPALVPDSPRLTEFGSFLAHSRRRDRQRQVAGRDGNRQAIDHHHDAGGQRPAAGGRRSGGGYRRRRQGQDGCAHRADHGGGFSCRNHRACPASSPACGRGRGGGYASPAHSKRSL